MKASLKSAFAAAMIVAAMLSGCGGGGGGAPGVDSATALNNAALALKSGDIDGARLGYDAALAADGDNREAAFGAGFTRLLQLAESDPSNATLSLLGQKSMKLSALFGPDGYLKAMEDVYRVDASLDTLEGPFQGTASVYGQDFFVDDTEECRMKLMHFHLTNTEKKTKLDGFVVLSIDAPDGTPLYRLEDGAEVGIGQKFAGELCFEQTPLAGVDVYENKTGFGNYKGNASGKIVAAKTSAEKGGSFSLHLQDVTLPNYEGDQQKTVSGDIADIISDEKPDPSPYFPFAVPADSELRVGRKALMLRLAKDGLMLSEMQDETLGYIPLVQEIAELFHRADADDAFQFVVPKELYFGGQDISLNRADLKAIRAGMEFGLAGLFFVNSWDCPFNIGDYYDENGKDLYGDEQVLEQLNQCLTLREDHHIDEAKEHIVQGFELALENDDLRQSVEVDGIFDDDGKGKGGYVELRDTVEILKNSLTEDQVFLYVDPALTLNLGHLFSNPPDASRVDVDPFVLENGEIKPVEAFFKAYLEGIVDFDTSAGYKNAFSALGKDFWHLVFDEFNVFTVGGKDIGFGDFYE